VVKRAQDRGSTHTLIVVVALTVVTERSIEGDYRQPEPEEPVPPTHARPGGKALWAAALATAAAGALVAAGLATSDGLLAAIWGGVFLAVTEGVLRSLRSPEPRGGG
jgi:hypothetical protein